MKILKYLLVFTWMISLAASAQEAVIRKNLSERLPQLPKIDEVSKSILPGIFEVRVNGSDIFYTDIKGDILIQGSLVDTKSKRNLTQDRVEKLTAMKFNELPFNDAFTIVRGDGKRKLAVFEDPNCGYCKKFEKDLQKIDNVTIYMFLYPILGADSVEKAKHIWCAADKGKIWQDWMIRDQLPATSTCSVDGVNRNVDFGRKFKITGTPTLIFADGSRVPGAIDTAQVETRLEEARK